MVDTATIEERPLYPPQRQAAILDLARQHGRVEVASLADTFDVTTETIRRDLSDLQRRRLVRRVHGGAILADEDGQFSDWIELFNPGPRELNLTGYGLSDDFSRPFKWQFADTVVGPAGFLVVFASGKDRQPEPVVYWCDSAPNPTPYFLLRTNVEPAAMAQTVRVALKELEPLRAVYELAPLDDQIDGAFAQNRLRTLLLGLKSLALHPMRSLLTVLGIFIGVASVVWLLAIGEGISQKAQEQIEQLGATNIIVRSVKPPDDSATAQRSFVTTYGLVTQMTKGHLPTAYLLTLAAMLLTAAAIWLLSHHDEKHVVPKHVTMKQQMAAPSSSVRKASPRRRTSGKRSNRMVTRILPLWRIISGSAKKTISPIVISMISKAPRGGLRKT